VTAAAPLTIYYYIRIPPTYRKITAKTKHNLTIYYMNIQFFNIIQLITLWYFILDTSRETILYG